MWGWENKRILIYANTCAQYDDFLRINFVKCNFPLLIVGFNSQPLMWILKLPMNLKSPQINGSHNMFPNQHMLNGQEASAIIF